MPSMDRAYGMRGAIIALWMALVAGGVQGVLAGAFDFLAVKVAVGLGGAIVLLMAGAISARRRMSSALALGLAMGVGFFVARWTCWALMTHGTAGAIDFASEPPSRWPGWLSAQGISEFWIFEAVSMTGTALFACYVGHERAD